MPIRAVCFDVGETLIDETREWNGWADFLGVPRLTLFTALGVSMWRGESHRKVFEIFRPDLDFSTVRQQRAAQGWRYGFEPADLYPDARSCLSELRERGYQGSDRWQPAEGSGTGIARAWICPWISLHPQRGGACRSRTPGFSNG